MYTIEDVRYREVSLYIFAICSLYMHYTFTIYIHYFFAICSLDVHYIFTMFIMFIQNVYYIFTIYSLYLLSSIFQGSIYWGEASPKRFSWKKLKSYFKYWSNMKTILSNQWRLLMSRNADSSQSWTLFFSKFSGGACPRTTLEGIKKFFLAAAWLQKIF